jgi:DHA1 family multidrug resistance protein-like MFS transporter
MRQFPPDRRQRREQEMTALRRIAHRGYTQIFHSYPALGWIAVAALFGQVANSSVSSFSLPFYVLYDLHQPGRVLGFLASSFLFVETLLKLPFGHLSDRYGRRPFVVVGLSALLFTPLVILLVPTHAFIAVPALIYVVLLPLRMIGGAGSAAAWPPLYAAVADRVPRKERGTGMAALNSAYIGGVALGPALAGLVSNLWRVTLAGKTPFLMASVAVILAALSARKLPPGVAPAEERSAQGALPSIGKIAVIVVITITEMFATATLGPYLALFVHRVTDMSRSTVGFFLLLIGVPALLVGIPIGRLVDRLPKRHVRQLSLIMSAVGMWVASFSYSVPMLTISGLTVVLGFLFGLPAWLALISDLVPQGRAGRIMGIMATAEGVGSFLGPLTGGYLWDVTIRGPFYASAGMLTIGALTAVLFVGRDWDRKAPSAGKSDHTSEGSHAPPAL